MEEVQNYDNEIFHFKEILKEELYRLMKCGENLLSTTPQQMIQVIPSYGYEISQTDYTLLEYWLEDILNLSFIRNTILAFGDSVIEEVIVHGPSWVQIIGSMRKEFFSKGPKKEDYQLALEVFAFKEKLLWNERVPFQSFQTRLFGEEWRATIVHPELGPSGVAKLFLRSQRRQSFPLKAFKISSGQTDFIEEMIIKKKNIIVCGSTGSGKTSLLQALLEKAPKRSHIAILEDTHEIHLDSPFVTKLLAQDKPGFTLKDFCHYALRLRPDRIVLGEIRSHEVVPFLLSLNTGHGGMMASLHANSALDAIQRLCLLFQVYSGETGIQYQEILKLLCTGIDLIIHMEDKKVVDILEIRGSEGMTPFYQSWN
jgi:type IV secretion system protein VirB11